MPGCGSTRPSRHRCGPSSVVIVAQARGKWLTRPSGGVNNTGACPRTSMVAVRPRKSIAVACGKPLLPNVSRAVTACSSISGRFDYCGYPTPIGGVVGQRGLEVVECDCRHVRSGQQLVHPHVSLVRVQAEPYPAADTLTQVGEVEVPALVPQRVIGRCMRAFIVGRGGERLGASVQQCWQCRCSACPGASVVSDPVAVAEAFQLLYVRADHNASAHRGEML